MSPEIQRVVKHLNLKDLLRYKKTGLYWINRLSSTLSLNYCRFADIFWSSVFHFNTRVNRLSILLWFVIGRKRRGGSRIYLITLLCFAHVLSSFLICLTAIAEGLTSSLFLIGVERLHDSSHDLQVRNKNNPTINFHPAQRHHSLNILTKMIELNLYLELFSNPKWAAISHWLS